MDYICPYFLLEMDTEDFWKCRNAWPHIPLSATAMTSSHIRAVIANAAFLTVRRLGVQDQGAGRFRVCWGPISWFIDGCLLCVPHVRGVRELCGVPFIRMLIPPSWSNHLPKAPLPNPSHWVRFQHVTLGGSHRHSVYDTGDVAKCPAMHRTASPQQGIMQPHMPTASR